MKKRKPSFRGGFGKIPSSPVQTRKNPKAPRSLENLLESSGCSILNEVLKEGDKESFDPFWEMVPPLVNSKFPTLQDSDLDRVSGFLRHAIKYPNNNMLPY